MYTAQASATNGRQGRTRTPDGRLDLALSMPKGLGGPGGEGTNPEELFALGYSACFGSALSFVAGMQKKKTGAFTIHASVTIGRDESGFGLAVSLEGEFPELSADEAMALMKAAHEVCPYSKATRGNVEVQLSVRS
jgi:Ohr subfamily peroxiredoxin